MSKRTKNLGHLLLAGPCERSFAGANFNGDTRVDLAPPGNGPRFRDGSDFAFDRFYALIVPSLAPRSATGPGCVKTLVGLES
jgi:hypothetical protein